MDGFAATRVERLPATIGTTNRRPIARIGERSSHTWFRSHTAGKADVRNYDGSWTKWGQPCGADRHERKNRVVPS